VEFPNHSTRGCRLQPRRVANHLYNPTYLLIPFPTMNFLFGRWPPLGGRAHPLFTSRKPWLQNGFGQRVSECRRVELCVAAAPPSGGHAHLLLTLRRPLKWYKAIRRTSGGLTLPSSLTVKVWSHTSPFYRCLPWSLSFLTKSSLPHSEHALTRDLSPVSPLPR
jgi:hypothetical protein